MLKIRQIIALLTVFAFLSYSCNSYQYYTLQGNLPKSQYSDFFFENDTLQIIYTFNGNNGPVTTKIFNKLDRPLFINWSQSSFIINGKNFNYQISSKQLYESKETYDDNMDMSVKNSNLEFIAPLSELTTFHTNLNNQFIVPGNCDSTKYTQKYSSSTGYPTKVKEYYYSEDNSPILFRNYLTYTVDPKIENQHSIDSQFWISNIFKTNNGSIPYSPDMFRVSKSSSFTTTIALVTVMGLSILGLIFAEPDNNIKR